MVRSSLEDTVRQLGDREAIRDLARRYAHHVWQKDVPGVVALFAEDAAMDTGEGQEVRGRAAIAEAYQQMLASSAFHPFVHNHVIELRGDRATGTCYLDLRASVEGRSMIGAGVYDDDYLRIDGEWKFASRTLRMHHFVPLREGWAEAGARERGSRSS